VAVATPASDPVQWPATSTVDPELSGTPNSVRIGGADRYQTNSAMNLVLRGDGGYPFSTSDPTSAGAASLAAAHGWWGAGTCPRSIIVVAGDTVADSLEAASLSDPTDRSSQPRVQRVAAADPTFDVPGAFDRVDTAYAPIVVTEAARAGATRLSPTARATAEDLSRGGCSTAREAILVGGSVAVPVGVEQELVSLGYREVFRVAGADRYETAAAVAGALGVGPGVADGTPCADPDSTDGSTRLGWYGNAVVEFRGTPTTCLLLSKAAVLTDGDTGADALAAGWWTSRWQVPVLLVAADGSLPPATRAALGNLGVGTLIALGGLARIPNATFEEATLLSGAHRAGQIGGPDRYATSVAMAKGFGGWNPTGVAHDSAGDIVCLAGSSGNGPSASGWPDALAAGPLCARLGARSSGGPERVALPLDGPGSLVEPASRLRSHDAVPILLTPTGAASLSEEVGSFLAASFASGSWCTGSSVDASCLAPGFAVVVGGAGVVPDAVENDVATRVAPGQGGPPTPTLDGAFYTRLDMRPVFNVGPGGAVCVPRAGVRGARWLRVLGEAPTRSVLQSDLVSSGIVRGPSPPLCLTVPDRTRLAAAALLPGGRTSTVATFDASDARYAHLSSEIMQRSGRESVGGRLNWSTEGTPGGIELLFGAAGRPLRRAALDLTLSLTSATSADVVGVAELESDSASLRGEFVGEGRLVDGAWQVVAAIDLAPSSVGPLRGGFRLTVTPNGTSTDQLTWVADGVAR
jgi:hypothetical protein